MRTLLLLTTLAALLHAADEPATDENVVRRVRALLSARKEDERAALLAELKSAESLDWASVKAGLRKGPYLTDPLSTEFGERHAHRHLSLRLTGEDKRDRTFSFWLPKAYKADRKIPVLFYLHHEAGNEDYNSLRAQPALLAFKEICEREAILFVAPSTNRGAEWWTPEGRNLVRWTLAELRARYNLDEDRIALMGLIDGATGAWSLAQHFPDTWSCLISLTGGPTVLAASFHPLYMGTLDRMDVYAAVTGSNPGGLDLPRMLDALKPMLAHPMRFTLRPFPDVGHDASYLDKVLEEVVRFARARERKPYPDEVDVETEAKEGARSLWLEVHGVDPEGETPPDFPSSIYPWTTPKPEPARPRLGVGVHPRGAGRPGLLVQSAEGGAQRAGIGPGDVILEIDGAPVNAPEELRAAVEKHGWNEDVHVLLAREVPRDDLERLRAQQERYERRRSRLVELEREGKQGLDVDDLEEAEPETPEDDGGGESSLEMGGGTDGGAGGEAGGGAGATEGVWFLFDRYVRLREPEGEFVRSDFGASWDREFAEDGVRVTKVVPHGRAWRAGIRDGDVLYGIGGTAIHTIRDVAAFFSDFDFKGFVDFDVKRRNEQGEWEEKTATVQWDPPIAARVDAKWDRKERVLDVKARLASGFTIFFSEELMSPGEPFHLFVNGIPYHDLVDPASAPDYPEPAHGDIYGQEAREKARKERAKLPGWTPDPKWAIEDALARRDRSLVHGARLVVDLKALKPGFAAAKERAERRRAEREARLEEARRAHAGAAGR
jgi:hypothetical protein